jgi:hypothetical protein
MLNSRPAIAYDPWISNYRVLLLLLVGAGCSSAADFAASDEMRRRERSDRDDIFVGMVALQAVTAGTGALWARPFVFQ